MEENKKSEELTDADLWALKTIELIKLENDMRSDPKYGPEDFEEIKELQADVLNRMNEAEEQEEKEKEGKTL